MFTESEFATLTQCADASGKCPSEWLRDVALKNMAPSWMGMSREVVEVRVAVNTIAELLFKVFPDRLPAEFIKDVVKEGRAAVSSIQIEGEKERRKHGVEASAEDREAGHSGEAGRRDS